VTTLANAQLATTLVSILLRHACLSDVLMTHHLSMTEGYFRITAELSIFQLLCATDAMWATVSMVAWPNQNANSKPNASLMANSSAWLHVRKLPVAAHM
jgi:hypothetical protein